MAKFTLEELYYGDKYNIMGNAAAEILRRGTCEDVQTEIELCLITHCWPHSAWHRTAMKSTESEKNKFGAVLFDTFFKRQTISI